MIILHPPITDLPSNLSRSHTSCIQYYTSENRLRQTELVSANKTLAEDEYRRISLDGLIFISYARSIFS